MKKVIISILFFMSAMNALGQTDTSKLSLIIENQITSNNFEGTVLIAEKGNVIFQRSAGYKDRDIQSPVDNDTRYGITSITKMLTAILILQLAEEGSLSLQDNLRYLLPELNIPGGENITIHHLLLHISGLPNENDSIYLGKKSPEEFVRETLIDGVPGEFGKFNYSNIDYVLLGLIIEKKTGRSWQDIVTEKIINNLDLKNTGFLSDYKIKAGNYEAIRKMMLIK